MSYLKVDGGQVYYHRVGEGVPIVFVNDWVLSLAYWQTVTRELSRDFCCVTYDPRGFGRSTSFPPTAPFDIETHAHELHELIVSLRAGYVHLVGHGLGAVVAGLCLKAHPQDVQTLSLITAESELGTETFIEDRLKYIQMLIVLRRWATWPLVRSLILRRYSLGHLPWVLRKELLHDFAHLNPRAAWQTISTALEDQPFQDYIAGVSQSAVPVLLLACGRDNLVPVESVRKMFARVHRGRLVTMHSTGHFPMLESPEKFIEILRNFLAVAVPGTSKQLTE
jgi:pimeloyl-ACP methyl ester carboxylesterase